MGCWNETCAISNLPIRAGDPTYLVMLTNTPWEYKDGRTGCYFNDHWFLRALPVLGEYDDYGKIENWEENWIVDLINDQFKIDLVPNEQNSREELLGIPAQAVENINFDNILDWLREGNVKVRSGLGGAREELNVVKCLIRKDVWDLLLQMSWKDWRNTYSHSKTEEDIRKYIEILLECHRRTAHTKDAWRFRSEFENLVSDCWYENSFISPFYANPKPGPTLTGGYEFFKRWIDDRLINGDFSEEEAFQKYLKVGEVVHVELMLSSLRKSWCPTTGSGSQDQEWDQSLKFNLGVAKLAYREEMDSLSEEMGFSEKDFSKVKNTKKNKSLLEDMEQTRHRRKEVESLVQNFLRETLEINVEMEKKGSGE